VKLAIHQPQYLPWLPYFLKIEESDLFIFLDTVDFQKNGLQNRNQIKTSQGGQWLTVPVMQQLGQKIAQTTIDNKTNWRKKHWQAIQQCYGRAAAFGRYAQELEDVYAREWTNLSELNIELTVMMMQCLGITTPVIKSSEMTASGVASELVLNLCLEAKADRYLSGTGGMNYLQEEAFANAGVMIDYRPSVLPTAYPQMFAKAGFINHLSALDIILNCGDTWKAYLPEEAVKA
jgi:hypothetical protein